MWACVSSQGQCQSSWTWCFFPLGFPQALPVRGKNSCIWVQAADPDGWDALAVCPLTRSVLSQWFWSKHWFLWHRPIWKQRHKSFQICTFFFLSQKIWKGQIQIHKEVTFSWDESCAAWLRKESYGISLSYRQYIYMMLEKIDLLC